MDDVKAYRYYARLSELGDQQPIATTLSQVADALFTSPRHARTLLKQLTEKGWLSWSPKVGRNQRSSLALHYPLPQLQLQLAKSLISRNAYDTALTLLDGDQQLFGQALQQSSGVSLDQGQLRVQLTYRRQLQPLLPQLPQRNTERFFLRQIYCCLVQSDEQGKVTPQLAHHWRYDKDRLRWTFYLRPKLRFHDGSVCDANEVAKLFNAMRQLPAYAASLSHITAVNAADALSLEFQLASHDASFALLLSDLRFSIQPSHQLALSQTSAPIGCGPFRVSECSTSKLQLEPFEQYHGYRAFVDRVTIWLFDRDPSAANNLAPIPPQHTMSSSPRVSTLVEQACGADTADTSDDSDYSRTEDGCLHLLVNQVKWQGEQQARLAAVLAQLTQADIEQQCQAQGTLLRAIPAHNLLLNWLAVPRHQPLKNAALPSKLSIAVYDETTLLSCAAAIKALLAPLGVACQVNRYSYAELCQRSQQPMDDDLILMSINLDDNRQSSAYLWLLNNTPLQRCLPPAQQQWLRNELAAIRAIAPGPDFLKALESIATTLIYQGALLPLFHEKQTLRCDKALQGVRITHWGWPAIQEVWSAGESH